MGAKRVIGLCLLVLAAGVGCTSQTSTPDHQPVTGEASASPAPACSESTAAIGYECGYGTYYVATRRKVPQNWGNAKTWYAYAQRDGYSVGDTPKKGAIAWTDVGPSGQVAIVEDVSVDGTEVTISEMNGKGGWNRESTRTAPSASFKYIYIFY